MTEYSIFESHLAMSSPYLATDILDDFLEGGS